MRVQKKVIEEAYVSGEILKRSEQLQIEPDEAMSFQNFIDLMSNEELEQCMRLIVPVIKLDTNSYIVGTQKRQLLMKNTNLLMRVGGGFMELNEYLRQEAKFECLKISMAMDKQQQTYQEVLVDILKDRNASEKVINQFRRNTSQAKIPFKEILDAVKSREVGRWKSKKSRLSAQASSEEVKENQSPLLRNQSSASMNLSSQSRNI